MTVYVIICMWYAATAICLVSLSSISILVLIWSFSQNLSIFVLAVEILNCSTDKLYLILAGGHLLVWQLLSHLKTKRYLTYFDLFKSDTMISSPIVLWYCVYTFKKWGWQLALYPLASMSIGIITGVAVNWNSSMFPVLNLINPLYWPQNW